MEALTLAELRALAKLHRAGVEGSAERLAAIITTDHHLLPGLLGFPAKNLERLLSHDEPVAVLVATIEAAPKVARLARVQAENEQAQALALNIGLRCALNDDGTLELPLAELTDLARLGDVPQLAFGQRGGVHTRHLLAVLRACARTSVCRVLVREQHLELQYEGPCSRGVIRLRLAPVLRPDDSIVIPLRAAASTIVEPLPAPPAPAITHSVRSSLIATLQTIQHGTTRLTGMVRAGGALRRRGRLETIPVSLCAARLTGRTPEGGTREVCVIFTPMISPGSARRRSMRPTEGYERADHRTGSRFDVTHGTGGLAEAIRSEADLDQREAGRQLVSRVCVPAEPRPTRSRYVAS